LRGIALVRGNPVESGRASQRKRRVKEPESEAQSNSAQGGKVRKE